MSGTRQSSDQLVYHSAGPETVLAPNDRGAVQAAITAFFVLFCIVGLALWGLPFYYDFMVQQFGWTRAQVTSGNALSKLFVGPIFGFIAGWIIDLFGPKRVMVAGVLMAGIALVGLGYVSTLPMFYFFYLFNALGYVCGGPLPHQVLLTRWFDKGRGKAMGFAYLGIGVGGASVPWISHWLVDHFGWQFALRMLGVMVVVISLPMALLVREGPAGALIHNKADQVAAKATFKTPAFFLLTFGSICSIAAVSGTQQNLKLFLSLDRHFSQAEAARVLSLVLGFSIGGRLLMGWLADRFSKKYVMLLTYLLVSAGIPFLFWGQNHSIIYASAAVFGIGLGGDYMIVPLIAAEIFDIRFLGRLLGLILTAGGIAEALSPWLVGLMRDNTGSYDQSCVLLLGVSLLGAISVLALPQRRRLA